MNPFSLLSLGEHGEYPKKSIVTLSVECCLAGVGVRTLKGSGLRRRSNH
jgi:hypothetical protein